MKYLVLALLLIVAVWYFFIRVDPTAPATTHAVALSPEQQWQELLAQDTVEAPRLAALCAAYPQLAARLLNGKQIRIRGTVSAVHETGMEGRRADVFLETDGARKLAMICDLDQYGGPGVNFRYIGWFRALGTELLYLAEKKTELIKRVVITEGAEVTQFGTLTRIGGSLIEFQMVNGPLWANAELNQ
jgi:hypothetical protein